MVLTILIIQELNKKTKENVTSKDFCQHVLCDQNHIFFIIYFTNLLPLTTYHLPFTTYHIPPTTYHLPLTTYYLPLTTYRIPLNTYHLPLATYHLLLTTYHLQLFCAFLEKDWVTLASSKDAGEGTKTHTDRQTDTCMDITT